jgi:tetratricopeptide (TPR) repeat protein
MSDDFARIKAIVLSAREREGPARAAYLDEACRERPDLRAEIDALLAHDPDTPSLLATGGLAQALTSEPAPAASASATAPLPRAIGPYTPVAVLGEGGMGTVYRAEQTTPIRREVALKVIRRGLDTDRVVARFESERQALALMDHPHIARVLDAGTTADGRPYFVMELVDGVPITTFCESRQLVLADRLALFLAVCQGVQHAHQKGIIHRDLKPSNVLVREQDGAALPKIIDFGIAKAMADAHGGGTFVTDVGRAIGTPDYMSPEQAGVLDGGVDTRSDVYSLGVLLYELVTGQRPFEFSTSTPASMRQALSGEEPARPSTRSDRWMRLLAGDLDNIILKALSKAPADRYSSVEQFADDIRRHLDGLPVKARAATWGYRAAKFAGRHRLGLGVAAVLVVLVVGFAVAMAVQSARLAAERDRAVAAEQRARTEAETAGRVTSFMVDLFEVSDPSESRGNSVTAREILDRGAARIERELTDQPEVRAFMMDTIGRVYQGLGLFDVARPLLAEALRIRRELWGEDHAQVADSLDRVARLAMVSDEPLDAEPMFRQALAMKEKWLGPRHPSVALTMNHLAMVLRRREDLEPAETLAREALAIRRETLGNDHADVAESLHDLGTVLASRGKLDEAETTLRQALDLDRRLHGDAPVVVIGLNSLATVLESRGDAAGAAVAIDEALAIARRIHGDEHPDVAHTMWRAGRLARLQGELDEAESLLDDSIAMHRRVQGDQSVWVAMGLNEVARVRRARSDLPGAERFHREALALYRQVYGSEHSEVAGVLLDLGSLAQNRANYREAESLYREAIAIDRKLLGDQHLDVAGDLNYLAGLLLETGDFDGAEAAFRESLPIYREAYTRPHRSLAYALAGLGEALLRQGEAAEAAPLLREAVEIRRAVLPPGDDAIARAEKLLQEAETAAPIR